VIDSAATDLETLSMSIREPLERVLAAPTADDLRKLRAEMLAEGHPRESRTWTVVEEFHGYLDQLVTSTTSREYSELASKLDISAVGGVVLEQMIEHEGPGDLALRFLTGLLSEGLMVAATRQHVKAWEGELSAVYRRTAWYLYGEMWRWTEQRTPRLSGAERRVLLDRLFEPVHSTDASGFSKAVLLGLLFQVLLAAYFSEEAPEASPFPGSAASDPRRD
jgi:hypothetical protein